MRPSVRLALIALAWAGATLFSAPSPAAPAAPAAPAEDPRALFETGVAAAAEADYASALQSFVAARDAGLAGPAVHYNIGVCAWALGELELAEQAFLETARHPDMASLAHYNLGLVSARRGEVAAARNWFDQVLREAGTQPDVQQLAAAGLASLPPPAGINIPPAGGRPTAAFFSAAAGYDDNVALVADGELLGVSELDSPYWELQAAVSTPLLTDTSLQAGVFLVDYSDLPELDQRSAQLELLYRPRLQGWRLELGAGYALNQLDGERFEDERTVLFGATRVLERGWRLRLRLRAADVEGRAPFEGLTGDRFEASLRLRRQSGPASIEAEYRFESNDRASSELSPDRHGIALEWRRELAAGLRTTLALDWRHSRYETPGLSWTERRTTLSAGLGGPIAGRWEWALRYDLSDNSASVAEFEYDRNRFFAGVQALF